MVCNWNLILVIKSQLDINFLAPNRPRIVVAITNANV